MDQSRKGGVRTTTYFHIHYEQMDSGISYPLFQSPPLHSGNQGILCNLRNLTVIQGILSQVTLAYFDIA